MRSLSIFVVLVCACGIANGLTRFCPKMVTNGAIIGFGRVGNLLFEGNDKKDTFLSSRSDTLPSSAEPPFPIYVCTRNNDLSAIIASVPEERRCDLVFIQNGMLSQYLKGKGLQENTQALVYFAVSKLGEAPIDGITDMNPEGLTSVTGKWADDFASRLKAIGLTCHVVDADKFKISMLEKLIWICAFMAVGSKHQCTVGEAEKQHSAEVRALITELSAAAAKFEGVTFAEGVADRLCAYARSVAHFPTALKEFEWRNSYFMEMSLYYRQFTPKGIDPCPLHTALMMEAPGNLLFMARHNMKDKMKEFNKSRQTEDVPLGEVTYQPPSFAQGQKLPSNPEVEAIIESRRIFREEKAAKLAKEAEEKKRLLEEDGWRDDRFYASKTY